jgi:hypothetical protein
MTKHTPEEIYLDEGVPSQDTLKPGQGANYGREPIRIPNEALQIIHNLNRDQKRRFLELVGYATDSSVWKPGVDYSQRNNDSIKAHTMEELDQALETEGLTSEFKVKAIKLFEDAVNSSDDRLREGICQLLTDDVYALLFRPEQINIVEMLASYHDRG